MLKADKISRRYFRARKGANTFLAVQETSMVLKEGETVLLRGRSGSGKTTLLHMLSGLLQPTEGRVFLDDTDLYALPDRELSRLRNEKIAVVPQGRSAVETLTVLENILLPGQLYGVPRKQEDAERWLEALGIADLRNVMPAELSGGELRRAAIARALAGNPAVILADEPTGDLDDENTEIVLTALRQASRSGKAVLVVSHEDGAAAFADRVCRMEAGRLTEDAPASGGSGEA